MPRRAFNTDEPIAFFLTWTTYGSWLHGDERGWNRRGESGIQPPNPLFQEMASAEMKETAFLLSTPDRRTVESTIRRHCEIRNWQLHAVAARSNHVHVALTSPGYSPEQVRDQLKAWCTRKLKPSHPNRHRFWTEGASCRWINQEDDLDHAIVYVTEAQDRKGFEAD